MTLHAFCQAKETYPTKAAVQLKSTYIGNIEILVLLCRSWEVETSSAVAVVPAWGRQSQLRGRRSVGRQAWGRRRVSVMTRCTVHHRHRHRHRCCCLPSLSSAPMYFPAWGTRMPLKPTEKNNPSVIGCRIKLTGRRVWRVKMSCKLSLAQS